MKKFITSFLVFLLCFNIILENTLILSNAQNMQESIIEVHSNDDIKSDASQGTTDDITTSQTDTTTDNTESSVSQETIDDVTPSLSNQDSNPQNSLENEIQPDPKENPKHIMGGYSSEYNVPSIISSRQSKPKLNSKAIGSGTVKSDTLNVRSGPSTSYNKVGTLKKDDYVEIYARSNGWYKIVHNNKFAYVSSNYINLYPIEKGIDVSKWNGYIDWNKVKSSGIDYVIIRAGYGSSTVDPNFKSYIEGASAAGLKIGVYWFSYATSIEKVKIEASKCLETINPYKSKLSYPVYFDYEYDSVDYAERQGITITKDLASQMANTFLDIVKSSGYDTGIYTNQDFSNNYFNADLLYSNNLWIAQYNSQCTFNKPYMMWQYTHKGSVDGIEGNVDINYTCLKSMKYDYNGDVPPNDDIESNVAYKTHVEDYGWLDWKSNGEMSGTTGKNKQVESIRIKLENMNGYSVKYRAHVEDYGWLDWQYDGEIAGTVGQNKNLQAIEVKIVKSSEKVNVDYRTHVQDYGWLNWTSNGNLAGTTGQNKRVESIQIMLNNAPSNANIVYETHVQDYGWIGSSSNGNPNGTTGQDKQVEAIKIKLENLNGYSVKYRVHVKDYGWLDWKYTGEIAGPVGQNKQIEAIEIKLVE